MSTAELPLAAATMTGFHAADVFKALQLDVPQSALFTTFTFSPGTFQHQYLNPLLHCGCGDVVVLADSIGYAQSLFASARAEGIGIDYRLRPVSLKGSFHAKLVLVRMRSAALVAVGSGNLTAPGLHTNAEVGAMYRLEAADQVAAFDALCARLRSLGELAETTSGAVAPMRLAPGSRLLTSLDSPIFDQLEMPSSVRRIEIVSPFMDEQLEVVRRLRERFPTARLRLRIDPKFGALTKSLLDARDEKTEVLVPVEHGEHAEGSRRPPVHGKLICFLGDSAATVVLGSANLSRPALLTKENFEAVVERRMPVNEAEKLLDIPGLEWRPATADDRTGGVHEQDQFITGHLHAAVVLRMLTVSWSGAAGAAGVLRIKSHGKTLYTTEVQAGPFLGTKCQVEVELPAEVREAFDRPAFVEIEQDGDKLWRGWIDVTDVLELPPDLKRQRALAEAIASDPLNCEEKDVVKFIELLQRNLMKQSLGSPFGWGPHVPGQEAPEPDGESLVPRRMLLEVGVGDGLTHSLALSRLLNRTLESAVRDLRFFSRDKAIGGTDGDGRLGSRESSPPKNGRKQKNALPPKIGRVLEKLFGQMAESVDSAQAARDVVRLISQIPTCIKALAYAATRWRKSASTDWLKLYFQKVVVACLAPGTGSILCHAGAIRRLPQPERSALVGGPEFRLGVATLEMYLLLDFAVESWGNASFMKDLLDVLEEVPRPSAQELASVSPDLWFLKGRKPEEAPSDQDRLASEARKKTGEMATLLERRNALVELVELVNKGVRDHGTLRPLAERVTTPSTPEDLLSTVTAGGRRLALVEIPSAATACPSCCMTLPVGALNRLKKASNVHRCSNCSVLLARAINQ